MPYRARNIIYALCAPDGAVRYVGRSTSGLGRPRSHGCEGALRTREHLPVSRWVRSLQRRGESYVIEVVEECATARELGDAERLWIASFRAWGFRLLNCTDGGEAESAPHSPTTRARLSAAQRAIMATDEGRARQLAASEKGASAVRGRPFTAEHRAKISAAMRGNRNRRAAADQAAR